MQAPGGQGGGGEHRIGKALAQCRNGFQKERALRRCRLEVDLQKFSRTGRAQGGEGLGEGKRLRIAHDRRLVTIHLDMRDRDQARALWRSQRMMARRKQHSLPAQDDGGGKIGHRRVANIDEAQIVVAVPRPEDERRQVDGHPGASGYVLIADQENQKQQRSKRKAGSEQKAHRSRLNWRGDCHSSFALTATQWVATKAPGVEVPSPASCADEVNFTPPARVAMFARCSADSSRPRLCRAPAS